MVCHPAGSPCAGKWKSISMRWMAIVVIVLILVVSLKDAIGIYFVYHFAFYFDAIDSVLRCPVHQRIGAVPSVSSANRSWEDLITDQLSSPHSGWIVSKHPVTLGLCNRILDITSSFLLAVATNRTLWIEWDEQPQYTMNPVEIVGSSSFQSIFNSSFHETRFRPPDNITDRIPLASDCFLQQIVGASDLSLIFMNHSVVEIARCDWWGGLLLKNPQYARTVFHGLNISLGFPMIFRSLFKLHPPFPQPVECSWMIQIRVDLPGPWFHVPPTDDFFRCAFAGGMTFLDYKTTWIVTDNKKRLLERSSPKAKRMLSMMNLPTREKTCRGTCGDRRTMETIYKLSQCKRAVLTFGSSFGSCITSLAGVSQVFRVGRYGDCHALPSAEPYDMNTFSRYGNAATFLASKGH